MFDDAKALLYAAIFHCFLQLAMQCILIYAMLFKQKLEVWSYVNIFQSISFVIHLLKKVFHEVSNNKKNVNQTLLHLATTLMITFKI